jgi:hypothetical protein
MVKVDEDVTTDIVAKPPPGVDHVGALVPAEVNT